MTPFRIKVLLFMLPMLLPIGRVDAPREAQSEIAIFPPTPSQATPEASAAAPIGLTPAKSR